MSDRTMRLYGLPKLHKNGDVRASKTRFLPEGVFRLDLSLLLVVLAFRFNARWINDRERIRTLQVMAHHCWLFCCIVSFFSSDSVMRHRLKWFPSTYPIHWRFRSVEVLLRESFLSSYQPSAVLFFLSRNNKEAYPWLNVPIFYSHGSMFTRGFVFRRQLFYIAKYVSEDFLLR